MKILNVHERAYPASAERVGELLDSLASTNDRLWPYEKWPAMKFEDGLKKGAKGGHGPVRYTVTDLIPGRRAEFEFDRDGIAAGMYGNHYFEVESKGENTTLRHVIDAQAAFGDWLRWFIVIRPLHNALVEEGLDKAETDLTGKVERPYSYGLYTRFLRFLVRRGR